MKGEYTPEYVKQIAVWCRENSSGIYRNSAIAGDILGAYAATLRQQAGRVDEITDEAVNRALSTFNTARNREGDVAGVAMRKVLTEFAALAQNTQGEAVAWQYRRVDGEEGPSPYWQNMTREQYEMFRDSPRSNCEIRELFTLHAERARVPEQRAHQWDRDGERCVVCGDKDWMGGPCNGPRTAAPSQRAEVK